MYISVIVPIYNVEKELDRCIQSIINQTYQKLEIILVDDGSTDQCPVICDRYAQQDARIIVIHKENGGQSSARNAGLRVATGEYVLFVDSDDYIALDSCEKLLKAMMPDVDIAVAAFKEVTENKVIHRGRINVEEGRVYSSKEFVTMAIRDKSWFPSVVNRLYRRCFLINNNLYFKEGIVFEDFHILLKTFLLADKVVYISYPFYNYVIREGSTMRAKGIEKKADLIVEIYDEWMDQISSLDDPEYQRLLYGNLVRFYMGSCRTFKIRTWRIKGTSFGFAMKYALNSVERLKILGFTFLKDVFLRL